MSSHTKTDDEIDETCRAGLCCIACDRSIWPENDEGIEAFLAEHISHGPVYMVALDEKTGDIYIGYRFVRPS